MTVLPSGYSERFISDFSYVLSAIFDERYQDDQDEPLESIFSVEVTISKVNPYRHRYCLHGLSALPYSCTDFSILNDSCIPNPRGLDS